MLGESDKCIATFNLADRVHEALGNPGFVGTGNQVEDDLSVHGGLEDRAAIDKLASQGAGIGQVAVMGNGEAATIEISENRLNIADGRRTLCRIAVMADRGRARQAGSHVFTDEIVADEAGMAFIVEEAGFLIEAGNAAGFLTTMLEGVEAERGQNRGFRVAENTKNTAFLAELIVIMVPKHHGV